MSAVIGNPLLATGADGYQISRSVRFRSSAGAYFSRTPAAASNRKTWTWSAWVKRGTLGTVQTLFSAYSGSNNDSINFTAADKLELFSASTALAARVTQRSLRDSGAFYHLVVNSNTPDASAPNRSMMWVNGDLISAWDTFATITQNSDWFINSNVQHNIGRFVTGGNFDGYMTEVNFIDGQALTASSFGEFDSATGVWKPKKYSGTYGTNGFYLDFADNSGVTATTIGKDRAGSNNWTPTGISVTAGVTYDSMLDVPVQFADGSNGRGNYATLNPLHGLRTGNPTNGNLSAPATQVQRAAFDVATFESYWEVTATGGTVSNAGTINSSSTLSAMVAIPSGATYGFRFGGASSQLSYTTDGVNWTALGSTGVNSDRFPATNNTTGTGSADFNFGQRPFVYAKPAGYEAVHTGSMLVPSIIKSNQFMDATVYTGNNTSGRSIVNIGQFQPDLVWIKNRTTANNNILTDAVRGATRTLISNTTDYDTAVAGALTAFNTNGFQVGYDGTTIVNASGNSYVAWQWKEGATPGFDIVTYTGTGAVQTIAHSLGDIPALLIVKQRTIPSTTNWAVWHKAISAGNFMLLNTTGASVAGATYWNGTTPGASVFTLGSHPDTNASGGSYVAYLFSEVIGFSKIGGYVGNASTDGPFVYCGFRPKWVMVKRVDVADNWHVYDSVRSPQNVAAALLRPNTADVEATFNAIDFLSNGFKIRDSGTGFNASGGTYLHVAFAENPYKYSLAR